MDAGSNKAEALARACQHAFQLYPHDCSHAVWQVIREYNPDQPYMQANQLLAQVSRTPQWKEVQLSELSNLANEGTLVIGGVPGDPHGHVIVVYPGSEKSSGGFYYTSKRTGERKMAAQRGMYPRAMSTSFSRNPYPGAISNGEKTVRDPWSEAEFKKIRFWRYEGGHGAEAATKDGDKLPAQSESIWI